MKEEVKALQEGIARTFEEFKTRNDAALEDAKKHGGEIRAELGEKIDRANADITAMRQEQEKLVQRMKLPEQKDDGDNIDDALQMRAFEKFIRHGKGENTQATYTPEEIRALAGTSDADGGYLVPPAFAAGILMAAYNLEALRPICSVSTTGRDVVHFGSLSKPSMAWGRAGIAVDQQTLTSGGQKMTIYDLAGLTLVANNTLDDTESNVMQKMMQAFGRAIAESEDNAFAAAAGDDSPQGIVATAAVKAIYKYSGVTAALSDATHNGVDTLIDCLYTPKSLYRLNYTWAMNSTTEAAVRKLKNGEGDYIWEPSLQAGSPARILGRPVVNPEGMPDIGAGTFPIVGGDFMAGYEIADRKGMTIQRLVERYAEFRQTGFMITKRVGGMVTLPEAFCCVKIATS